MTPRQHRPAVLLTAFALLLAAMFGAAYAVGATMGPVAPGIRDSGGTGHDGGGGSGGSGDDGGGMGGMHGMGGAR
ncbi:hypothetical protein [Streptomyces sp. NPDC048636]|uniref:hypothetical protein n=1 Tax=Streptomyces sp. NPDC048636 TaxID=3155762 RepID=UPI0034153437